ncbi:MAG: TIR domain-containing protein, partial [Nitrospira sp.]|nr:TIR domain-containing protein [Nitrospira sp.]
MSDIFISYSSADKGRVQALAKALEWKGWSVWWDRRIPAGKSFDDVIHEALKTARSVVVVWTKTSVKRTWVKNESRSGLRRNILFPVMLLDEVEIPLEFEHLQAAHLMDWQPDQEHAGFDQFIDDLAGVIGAPVTQSQGTPASPAKPTPEPETGLLQGAVRLSLISGNNNLSALTLSPGSLEPVFVPSVMDYTANVASDVTSVILSATKSDPDAVLSGVMTSGSGTATSQATIPLNGPGTVTPVVFTIAAPNGSSKTYRIMVNRAVLSGNNNLSVLTISPGALSPAFRPGTHGYSAEVASNVGSVMVTPRLQDANAMMTVDGQTTNSGEARTIALRGPGTNTLINIVVTAPNGAQKTYAVKIYRAAEVELAPERRDAPPASEMRDSRHPGLIERKLSRRRGQQSFR